MKTDKAKSLVDAILKNDLSKAKSMFKEQMTAEVGNKIGAVRNSVLKKMFSKNGS